MQLKHFVFNPFGVNGFVLWNESREAILIDPSASSSAEQDILYKFIKDRQLNITHLLNTHLHLDHVLGNAFVEKTFGIKAQAHQEDEFLLDLQEEQSDMYGLPFEEPAPPLGDYLAEGDTVQITGIKLQVFHIAGHSPGGLAFYCEKQGDTPPLLFSGDILFAGSMGRTDLFGGDSAALIKGIKQKLLTLPGETIVLPGHGPSTTIADERKWF